MMRRIHRRRYEPGADDDDAGHVGALSLTLMILSWKASSLTWNDSSTETFTSPIAAALDTSSANSPRAACWYESILRMPTPKIPQPSHPPRRYPRPEDAAPACPWKSRAVQTHRTRSFRYCATCGARCDARACVPKSVTVEPSRGPERLCRVEHRGPELKEGGFILGFLMLHFFPTQKTFTPRSIWCWRRISQFAN